MVNSLVRNYIIRFHENKWIIVQRDIQSVRQAITKSENQFARESNRRGKDQKESDQRQTDQSGTDQIRIINFWGDRIKITDYVWTRWTWNYRDYRDQYIQCSRWYLLYNASILLMSLSIVIEDIEFYLLNYYLLNSYRRKKKRMMIPPRHSSHEQFHLTDLKLPEILRDSLSDCFIV